jgi:hypothetical protein
LRLSFLTEGGIFFKVRICIVYAIIGIYHVICVA